MLLNTWTIMHHELRGYVLRTYEGVAFRKAASQNLLICNALTSSFVNRDISLRARIAASGRCNRINWCCGANLSQATTLHYQTNKGTYTHTHTHIIYIDPTFSINADSTRSFLLKVREGERLYGKNNKILAWGERRRQKRRGRRSPRGRERSAVFLQLSPFYSLPHWLLYFGSPPIVT